MSEGDGQGFVAPKREVMNVFDVGKWHKSQAYHEYLNFIKRLAKSVCSTPSTNKVAMGPTEKQIVEFLTNVEAWTSEFPPVDMGSQRFGNKAFTKWHEKLVENLPKIVPKILGDKAAAAVEIIPYLVDSFGNSVRIDYGSGHEAAFLIFIFCLYKLGLLKHPEDDRSVVLNVFRRYLLVCRHLQQIYRMEPAGSRGVHALDDFQFCPYIFGSSQLINNRSRLTPDDYIKEDQVAIYQNENLFFEAVQYVNENKTGPFYEHSNQLYNISAVPNWEKVNSGLFKMYEGEVLKKFPVVQHFLFGTLFPIAEKDPNAKTEDVQNSEAAATKPSHLDAIPE